MPVIFQIIPIWLFGVLVGWNAHRFLLACRRRADGGGDRRTGRPEPERYISHDHGFPGGLRTGRIGWLLAPRTRSGVASTPRC